MKNDKIIASWDKILPDEAADERMRSKIMEYKRSHNRKDRVISMKKIIPIAACSVLFVAVTAFMVIQNQWFSGKKDRIIMQEDIKVSEETNTDLVSSAKDNSKVIDEDVRKNNSELDTSDYSKEQFIDSEIIDDKSEVIPPVISDKDTVTDSNEQPIDLEIIDDRPEVILPEISDEDKALEQDDVNIYYVDNENVEYKTELLPLSPKYVFAFWKYYNKIGEEVTLNDIHIENGGSEYSEPGVAGYNGADSYVMNVKVSSNLKEYYKYVSEDKLIESLKQTLLGYSDDMPVEFNLIFE